MIIIKDGMLNDVIADSNEMQEVLDRHKNGEVKVSAKKRIEDTFFTKENCDRCNADVRKGQRTMSWFTEEMICVAKCKAEETVLRSSLPHGGRDHEGCGHIPEVQ